MAEKKINSRCAFPALEAPLNLTEGGSVLAKGALGLCFRGDE